MPLHRNGGVVLQSLTQGLTSPYIVIRVNRVEASANEARVSRHLLAVGMCNAAAALRGVIGISGLQLVFLLKLSDGVLLPLTRVVKVPFTLDHHSSIER